MNHQHTGCPQRASVGFPNLGLTVALLVAVLSTYTRNLRADIATTNPDSLLSQSESAVAWTNQSITRTEIQGRNQVDGRITNSFETTVQRFCDEGRLRIITDTNGDKKQRFDVLATNGLRVYYGEVARHGQIATSSGNISKWEKWDNGFSGNGGFLDSNFDFGSAATFSSALELLRTGKMQLRPDVETINGLPCNVLESETPIGELTVWIAPSEGYNLAKLEFHSKPGSGEQHNEEPLSILFDRAEYGQIGDRKVLIGGHYLDQWGDPHGITQGIDLNAHRTDVELTAKIDDPTLFTPSFVADGAQMVVDEDRTSGIIYVWKDGKAIPYEDDSTLTSIRDQIAEINAEKVVPEIPTTTQPSNSGGDTLPTGVGGGFIQPSLLSPWTLAAGIGAGVVLLVIAGLLTWPRKKHV